MNTLDALPATSKTIWLLSPYHTGSHASWANGFCTHSRHNVELLTMAGRFWKWRMHGGAIELAEQIRTRLAAGQQPDAIMATDMVNLAALQGLLRYELASELRTTPFLLYMHENQLTYPLRPGQKPDRAYAVINWTSQISADRIFFNSRYHLESWFAELPKLLKQYPDYTHITLLDKVQERSAILPVGIDCAHARTSVADAVSTHSGHLPSNDEERVGQVPQSDGAKADSSYVKRTLPPLILWNQRWEYDKQPEKFFALLYRLKEAGYGFRLAVAGENFRNAPAEFEEAKVRLADEIVHWGFVESYAGYVDLLRQSDLVISTAIHEFFGISVLEAIVAGAFPLLPNRLSYPELVPTALHPVCLYADEEALFEMAAQCLQSPLSAPPSLRQHVVDHFDWPTVAALYDEVIVNSSLEGR